MGRVTLVIGGARSGKSAYAVKVASSHRHVAYIATLEPRDDEMRTRVEAHKRSRPATWKVFEEPLEVEMAVQSAAEADFVIIDCATLWLTNLMMGERFGESQGPTAEEFERKVLDRVRDFLKEARAIRSDVCIVTNEVGMGIVPDNRLARVFRDVAGRANQMLAEAADEVVFVIAGLPVRVKPVAAASTSSGMVQIGGWAGRSSALRAATTSRRGGPCVRPP